MVSPRGNAYAPHGSLPFARECVHVHRLFVVSLCLYVHVFEPPLFTLLDERAPPRISSQA
jgi:hypothetical protein